MDVPLTVWYCDSCGEPIYEASHGMLEWTQPVKQVGRTFRIVHNPAHSPRGESRHCYENEGRAGRSDWHLHWATGPAGFARMLNLATRPILDPIRTVQVEAGSFLEVLARLHVSYYEEARRYYVNSQVCDRLREDGIADQALRPEIAKAAIEFAETAGIAPMHVPAPI